MIDRFDKNNENKLDSWIQQTKLSVPEAKIGERERLLHKIGQAPEKSSRSQLIFWRILSTGLAFALILVVMKFGYQGAPQADSQQKVIEDILEENFAVFYSGEFESDFKPEEILDAYELI